MGLKLTALLRAAHFLPTMTVTTLTFALGYRTSNPATAAGIALTVFSGQLIVGWSNDLIDYHDDLAHQRSYKPLVAGTVTVQIMRIAIAIDIFVVIALTIFGPLSGLYGLLHLVAVTSAVTYNLKLKQTVLSFLPYALSFGLLPVVVIGQTSYQIQWWYPTIGALFGVGVHLANVFKDLEQDRESGINGLPQILGERVSKIICATTFGSCAIILYWQTSSLGSLIILLGALLFLLPIPRKFAFPFAMVLGLAVMMVFIASNF